MTTSDVLVGGVSSNFRINPHNGQKTYVEKADGCRFWDINGSEYIDFFMGHGSNLLGHNVPELRQAIEKVMARGYYAGLDSEDNLALAELLGEHIPCVEAVRYTSSGTESTALVFRLLRGYTGRRLVIRIDGHFHGAVEYAIPNNLARKIDTTNPGGATSRFESVRGIPSNVTETVRLIPWNDIEALNQVLAEEGDQVAGLIMNPIDYNNGCITSSREYLLKVRDALHANGSLLVFDEVLSGFKTGINCAQGYYGVTPDMCTLSKALSNGVPVSVVAGKEDVLGIVMNERAPVLAGGTYSGNQIGVNAAIATLMKLSADGFYDRLLGNAEYFFDKLRGVFSDRAFPAVVQHLGCMFGIYFGTTSPVTDYRQFAELDWELSKRFFSECIARGLYFHTDFTVSAAHDREALDQALQTIDGVLKDIS